MAAPLLQQAEAVRADASLSSAQRLRSLLRLLHQANPARRKLLDTASGRRKNLTACTSLELMEALRAECAAAAQDVSALSPYKQAERLFRQPGREDAPGAVHTVDDAIAAGALDFSAPNDPPRADIVAVAAGRLYTLTSVPGFYFLPAYLSPPQQEYWTRRILRSFIEPPNRRNIDAAFDPDVSNAACAPVSIAVAAQGHSPTARGQAPVLPAGLWAAHCAGRELDWLAKLSWATLGYQYDWTARTYHVTADADYAVHAHAHERWHVPFPDDLHALAAEIAAFVDGHATERAQDMGMALEGMAAHGLPMTLNGQAGIVNVYQLRSPERGRLVLPMGGHSDNMERAFQFPVVSLSFGCTAVYLLGGRSKEEPPIPILIRSGDVTILSGDCRLALHGVPRVFEGTSPPALFSDGCRSRASEGGPPLGLANNGLPCDDAEERAFRKFLSSTRLNINVRQVFGARC